MSTDLVEPACLWGGLNKAYLCKTGVGTSFEGFELGLGGVGALDDGLSHIDSAGLVFAESVKRLIDQSGGRGATVDKGEVVFLNFTALLHFPKEGGVLFATCHQEKSARFPVKSADERKEFIGILVAKPVNEGESAIRTSGVN